MMKEYRGIDLSKHNIVTDWDKVASQVDFVILRAGGNFGGYYKDSRFEQYYNACKIKHIPVGAYYDVGREFTGIEKGSNYADHFRSLIAGHSFEYPVYADIEVTPKKYKKQITEAAVAFCENMEDHKYYVGIYGSDISTFHDAIIYDQVDSYTLWVARYGKKPNYVKRYAIWQYTSKGRIDGIIGNVDQDICTVDFPKIMKGVHLNGN